MPDAIPKGYSTVTPFLLPKDGSRLIEFLQRAFGAVPTFRMDHANGDVAHAELRIGDSMVMLGQSPDGRTMQCMLHLYVLDTDAVYRSAIAAGAESVREPADQFYGDRSAGVRDPEGNEWWIATHIEDVSPEEIERRMKALSAPA